MSKLSRTSTGGRGTEEIQRYTSSLLHRYEHHMGNFSPPIQPSVLAELQNAKVTYRQGSNHWISSLMPMGNGFVINVNESLPINRKRNAICHEIAHTFFFDTESEQPRRIKSSRPDAEEERLCFWAAREMLVPASLFREELSNLGHETTYFFEGILKLARIFQVSPDIVAWRLTHDLALLGDDWIVLWYSNSKKGEKLLPKSLYPKHISSSISDYMKAKVIENLRTALEQPEKENPQEIEVGPRKKLRFRVKTERINRERIYAISWVSPLSKLK